MRKESKVMKQCALMYKGLNIERTTVLHKTKLLLKIYRPVVWSTSNRAYQICESAECYCGKNLERALEYLANFAPETEQNRFSENVRSLFETHWLISLIDSTMNKIYEYPDNGKMYHEILSKQYLTVSKYSEQEMLELLNMERSTYYDKKREAIDLFAICLWGYTIPSMRGIFAAIEGESEIPSFFAVWTTPT
ncbi:hypothetical protein [Desnuesiella massiliensis]|jgi:hypothetical protein|uniref:hypothetical protein n=1 Tax=Desnuesiella massiliensis TaxID=1650662 RepID=UPI0006E40E23|nr:hypothetical protein [Desnuesiella massiliensis]HQA60103.1 hypothetical protein [Tepidanaerobacteraceae bacterium]